MFTNKFIYLFFYNQNNGTSGKVDDGQAGIRTDFKSFRPEKN